MRKFNHKITAHTVISGPISDGLSRISDEIEYSVIPSANFWSESPTYNQKLVIIGTDESSILKGA